MKGEIPSRGAETLRISFESSWVKQPPIDSPMGSASLRKVFGSHG